jgi:hypothetical protein
LFYSISKQLFEVAPDIKNLNKVWHSCIDWHKFYQSNDDDIEATMDSVWFNQLSQSDQELYRLAVTDSIQIGDRTGIVKVYIGLTHTAEEALHYLSSPLKIVIENSLNDAHFLKSIFKCFRQEAKQISSQIEDRRVIFAMGGGSTIEQVIRADMDSFEGSAFPQESHKYLRCLVLLDSDKKYRNEELKVGITNLVTFLDEHEICYHILEKREMENYLPKEAFSEIEANREFIDVYLSLNSEQKDFFDLEKGFDDINFESLDKNIQELYSDLSPESKTILRKQNLKKFISSDRNDFKNEFPKLFLSEKVTSAGFISRTKHQSNPNELKDIIDKVRKLL